ncbi:MAG: hypothetical protein JSW48_01660 [Betaproteobacteria bacterium]|nr:MAG: hypothetical protein JSW48_01660 [Betaproteobacteria bacterium]
MKRPEAGLVALAALTLLVGCAEKPPVDSQGKTPQQVLMETYHLILDGQYARARENFSPHFIDALITNNNATFIDYCGHVKGWRSDQLKTKLMGNDYNDKLWRVKLIQDEGKGEPSRQGILHDLYIVDGKWTIVFWGHYSKS